MFSERSLPGGAAVWRSRDGAASVVPADGCVDLIAHDGRVLVAGPSTRWIATLADGEGGSFGVRLPPGTASGVLRSELAELSDLLVPLEDTVDRTRARRLRETLLAAADTSVPADAAAAIAGPAVAEAAWSARSAVPHGPASPLATSLQRAGCRSARCADG